MVTAELAVALPALAVVVAGAAALLSAQSLQARCVDAAGVAARAAARGDPMAQVDALAIGDLPRAAVRTSSADGLERATVSAPLVLPLGLGSLTVSATASALLEPP